jgi:hypothetical protein
MGAHINHIPRSFVRRDQLGGLEVELRKSRHETLAALRNIAESSLVSLMSMHYGKNLCAVEACNKTVLLLSYIHSQVFVHYDLQVEGC